MTRRSLSALLLAGPLLLGAGPAAATEVVTSIKPVHALVAGVMQGIGTPHLIVRGGGSPHSFALRPSDARALAGAGLVFWIGPGLESFLAAPIEKLAQDARVVGLASVPGLRHLPAREGGAWERHHHDDHDDHDGHSDGQADHDGHDRRAGAGDGDPHLWLDPQNARAMVAAIATALQAADPAHAAGYAANAAALDARLASLMAAMAQDLAPVRDRPFVQFHDAFQYLEARFGLNAVGSVTVSPDRRPGAERLAALRARIRETGAVCIFAEPQFPPDLIAVVIEGSAVRTGVLDPLGADLADGPELYFALMQGNADALRRCLAPQG